MDPVGCRSLEDMCIHNIVKTNIDISEVTHIPGINEKYNNIIQLYNNREIINIRQNELSMCMCLDTTRFRHRLLVFTQAANQNRYKIDTKSI
jgi:hypothetical protein